MYSYKSLKCLEGSWHLDYDQNVNVIYRQSNTYLMINGKSDDPGAILTGEKSLYYDHIIHVMVWFYASLGPSSRDVIAYGIFISDRRHWAVLTNITILHWVVYDYNHQNGSVRFSRSHGCSYWYTIICDINIYRTTSCGASQVVWMNEWMNYLFSELYTKHLYVTCKTKLKMYNTTK